MSETRRSLLGLRVRSTAVARALAVSAAVVGVSLAGGSSALADTGGPGLDGSVFLSEVFTHGHEGEDDIVTNGDWIELYNAGGAGVSLNGAVLTDSDDDHVLPLPNVTLAAGAYLAVRTDADSLGGDAFSLGDGDQARLFASAADIGTNPPADELDFAHSPVHSWARDFDTFDPSQAEWLASGVQTPNDGNVFTSPHTNALAGVVINEVNPNGGANGDWIELINTNATGSVDVTGAILSDNDSSHAYVIGTNGGDTLTLDHGEIAAYRVDRETDNGNFGLGGSDAARLYSGAVLDLYNQGNDPSFDSEDQPPVAGSGGAPTVDKVLWNPAPLTSLGRLPDGSGTTGTSTDNSSGFVTTGAPSFGTANVPSGSFPHKDLSGVVINEIKTTGDADHGDWIELYNSGSVTRDLSNAIVADSDDDHYLRISNGTTLAAGATLAIRTDTDGGSEDSLGAPLPSQPVSFLGNGTFGLGDNDQARLFAADANAANLSADLAGPVDSFSWTEHAPTSYGRKANQTATNTQSSTVWGETRNPTFGVAANDFTNSTAYGLGFIQLNESTSRELSGDPISNDFIEIINTAPVDLDVEGMLLTDDGDDPIELSDDTIVEGTTTIAANGGVLYVEVDDNALDPNFGLGSDDAARLFAPGADPDASIPIDHNEWSDHPTDHQSLQRQNGGLSDWADCGPMTPGATNTVC